MEGDKKTATNTKAIIGAKAGSDLNLPEGVLVGFVAPYMPFKGVVINNEAGSVRGGARNT